MSMDMSFDANALYLWALNQALLTGALIRRRLEMNFLPERRDQYMAAYHWLDWLAHTAKKNILHKLNYGREKRVGPYPVDGYCVESNTIFQFHGCFYHGHQCHLTKNVKDQEQKQRCEKTAKVTEFLCSRGYKVV